MKLTILYAALMVLITASIAMAQCPNEMGCDVVYTCGQCHFTSKSCMSGCQPCDGGPCAAFQAASPVERQKMRTKQIIETIANPARLNERGMLWQAVNHGRPLLPNLGRAQGSHLPAGHPDVSHGIAPYQKCSIAQVVRLDLSHYR